MGEIGTVVNSCLRRLGSIGASLGRKSYAASPQDRAKHVDKLKKKKKTSRYSDGRRHRGSNTGT